MSGALLLLVMNFIGLALGPSFVGAASDLFPAHGSPHSLQASLCTLTPFYVIAIPLFLSLASHASSRGKQPHDRLRAFAAVARALRLSRRSCSPP